MSDKIGRFKVLGIDERKMGSSTANQRFRQLAAQGPAADKHHLLSTNRLRQQASTVVPSGRNILSGLPLYASIWMRPPCLEPTRLTMRVAPHQSIEGEVLHTYAPNNAIE